MPIWMPYCSCYTCCPFPGLYVAARTYILYQTQRGDGVYYIHFAINSLSLEIYRWQLTSPLQKEQSGIVIHVGWYVSVSLSWLYPLHKENWSYTRKGTTIYV